jgi:hypothetical protein
MFFFECDTSTQATVAYLVFPEDESNRSSDAVFASDIHFKQLRIIGDGVNSYAAARGAIHVGAGKLLRSLG